MRGPLEPQDSLEPPVVQEPRGFWVDPVQWANLEQKEKREMKGLQASQDFRDLRAYPLWRERG